mgnify:CR=1 FL=1
MLHGRFGKTTTAPYLEAHVAFPRLGLRGLVSFLVDTGADGTVLMPADSSNLGVRFGSLDNPSIAYGVGGAAKAFNERAVLAFTDNRHVYSYVVDMEHLAPTTRSQQLPSLLGRDILNRWRVAVDYSKRRVNFTPRTWDLRQKT